MSVMVHVTTTKTRPNKRQTKTNQPWNMEVLTKRISITRIMLRPQQSELKSLEPTAAYNVGKHH